MARTKEYIIDLFPIPWKRAGQNERHFYDRQTHEKTAVGIHLVSQHGSDPVFCGPLHMDLTFYMPLPKSLCKRKKTVWHHTTPDLDNLEKFLLDTITKTGVIWRDDRLVSSMSVKKIYDKHPRTHIVIKELE